MGPLAQASRSSRPCQPCESRRPQKLLTREEVYRYSLHLHRIYTQGKAEIALLGWALRTAPALGAAPGLDGNLKALKGIKLDRPLWLLWLGNLDGWLAYGARHGQIQALQIGKQLFAHGHCSSQTTTAMHLPFYVAASRLKCGNQAPTRLCQHIQRLLVTRQTHACSTQPCLSSNAQHPQPTRISPGPCGN